MRDTDRISRRGFLKAGAAGAAALGIAGCETTETPEGTDVLEAATGKKIPIGLQLYSVRGECEKDLPGVIAAVAKMGYQGVEFAGYYGRDAQTLRKLLDDNGIVCCGTHTGLGTLLGDELTKTIEFNRILGNKYLIVPGLPGERTGSREAWLSTALLFNELAAKVQPHGMRVGYHNHSAEFQPMDGQLPWDIFFRNTNRDVIMQLDTGNAMHGGADPLPYLAKYPGRAITVHIKEYSKTNDKALVGEGDINWKAIFAACETIGATEWYIVEQESYAYPPMECVERCLANLRTMGK
ncbi:MAG: sugar phosphate isomerase/epimerase [Planctomycetes bacterium]|nr:sugar phosphate isomerase/epimerase [Planctomycetota bacterium]